MADYIFADTRRVFRKQSFLAAIGAFAGVFLLLMFIYFNPAFTADSYMDKTISFLGFFPLFAGPAVFISVYYDDFKSRAMQVAIGYGISRHKVVSAKFIESLLLISVTALFMCAVVLIMPVVMSLSLSGEQVKTLVSAVVSELIRTVGYVSISAVPVFFTQNAVGGIICNILLSSRTVMLILTMTLGQQFFADVFGDLTQYLFTVQLYSIRNVFVQTGALSLSLLWVTAVYILLPVALSIVGFSKKELEF